MDPVTLISVAITGVNLAMKAIEAANAGNLAEAQRLLALARTHYAEAGAAWDAAPGPRT